MKKGLVALLIFVVAVLLWEITLRLGLVSRAIVPYPLEVLLAIPSGILPQATMSTFYGTDGVFHSYFPHVLDSLIGDFYVTLRRTILAFVIGTTTGIALGFVVFHAKAAKESGEFIVDFLRSIPATALVPLFLIFMGVGEASKVGVGAFSCGLVIARATIQGLQTRNAVRQQLADDLHLTGLRRIFYFEIPEIEKQLYVGIRAGVSLALILVVVSEMFIGSSSGVGKAIQDLYYTDQKPQLYVALIGSGVIGYALNRLVGNFEKRRTHDILERK